MRNPPNLVSTKRICACFVPCLMCQFLVVISAWFSWFKYYNINDLISITIPVYLPLTGRAQHTKRFLAWYNIPSRHKLKFIPSRGIELSETDSIVYSLVQKTNASQSSFGGRFDHFPFEFFMWILHRIPLYVFFLNTNTMTENVKNGHKVKSSWGGGGGFCLSANKITAALARKWPGYSDPRHRTARFPVRGSFFEVASHIL